MSKRALTNEQINGLAQRLNGTCSSVDAELAAMGLDLELQDLDAADCELLDAIVFECVFCNWWHGAGEHGADETAGFACTGCSPWT